MSMLVKEERIKDEKNGVMIIRRIMREDRPTARQWEEVTEEELPPKPSPPEPTIDPIEEMLKRICKKQSIDISDLYTTTSHDTYDK